MDFQQYVKAELLVLIPVLYLIGVAIKRSEVKDKYIPLILGGISIVLSAVWVVANSPVSNVTEVLTAIFTAVTQGILVAGASVYVNQIIKQTGEDKNE